MLLLGVAFKVSFSRDKGWLFDSSELVVLLLLPRTENAGDEGDEGVVEEVVAAAVGGDCRGRKSRPECRIGG